MMAAQNSPAGQVWSSVPETSRIGARIFSTGIAAFSIVAGSVWASRS